MKHLVSIATIAAMLAAPAALAQVVGKIPPPPEPTPEYTPPPAPPPPPPPKPAEPEKPLPSLVQRDENGRLRRYPEGTERAAIAAFDFDEEKKARIAAAETARAADLRKMVVEKSEAVAEALKVRRGLDEIRDFNEFARIKDVAAPLAAERRVDRLMREGAITALERARVDQVVKQYEEKLKEEWQQQTGSDILKIASLVAREKFTDVTRDALAAADELLLAAAPRLAGAAGELAIRADQKPAFDKAVSEIDAAPGDDPAVRQRRLDAITALYVDTLDADQRRKLLELGSGG